MPQTRKKGSSPDPPAPVLPGVCQARHGMIPPPGTPTHLSHTAVSLSIIGKPVSIPYSSVNICCICQKRKEIPQSNTEPSLFQNLNNQWISSLIEKKVSG